MRFYPIKTPRLLQQLYPKYLWRFSITKKEIYLTFDDGPTPEITEFILSVLDKYEAKATFFCTGKNIENNSLHFSKILTKNHTIGNHTFDHLNGWKTSTKKYIEDIFTAESFMKNEHVKYKYKNSKLFRPPYGKIRRKQAKTLEKKGYRIVMWDVLSADWDKTISKEKSLSFVLKNTKPGSIIVLHDSKKAEEKVKYILPKILDHFSKKGYKFKSIPSNIAALDQ